MTTPAHPDDAELDRIRRRRKRKSQRYAAQARAHGGRCELVDHHLVFLRDRYICYLCGEPTDFLAERHTPDAPTLDHVIALVDGGDHTYANCATAHRRCNLLKGPHHLPGRQLEDALAYLAALPDPRTWRRFIAPPGPVEDIGNTEDTEGTGPVQEEFPLALPSPASA